MADQTILLFLHGVGDGDKDDLWRGSLGSALERLGYPELDAIRVVAPKYPNALLGWDEKQSLPGLTAKEPSREAARKNRREFEHRMGAIEFRLGRHDQGTGVALLNAAVGAVVGTPPFRQVRNYLTNDQIRAQVLNRILARLPRSGRVVIIGHSLGSVIAADLVRRLPIGIEVAGMITIGSPLANGSFHVDKLKETLQDPPTNLAWWVNFWNAHDPVAAHRGVSSVFPWLIDFRINTGAILAQAHAAVEYLGNDAVAAAVGYALFGSSSKEIAEIDRGVDMPLDTAELLAVLALRYAHLMKARLEGDQRERFVGALRGVQATVIDDIRKRNAGEGRPLPRAILRLSFDLSDANAHVPEPLPSMHLTKEEAVVPLTVLAAENVLRPFEISLSKDKWRDAMKDLSAEMGLGSQFGSDVFAAAKTAETALAASRGVNWVKWGALGVGAAAIVVATGGLALGAGAGLAGAAAITSALATFGPGGMIGGLLTAGALVSAGGGGIAFGLASPGTSAKTLEAVVSRRLSAEILRGSQGIDPDPAAWNVLTEIEVEVRRQHERLDEFSDESAPSLKELKRKIETVERALKYLSENGLEPEVALGADYEGA